MGDTGHSPPMVTMERRGAEGAGAWPRPLQTPCPGRPWLLCKRKGMRPPRQRAAGILGRNSGSRSQLLLGLFAALNQLVCWAQPRYPMCRLVWDSAGEEGSGFGWQQGLRPEIQGSGLRGPRSPATPGTRGEDVE